jgi:hypothetical protein
MTEPTIEEIEPQAEDFTGELSDEALDRATDYFARCGCGACPCSDRKS